MPDLSFYRDPEKTEKGGQATAEKASTQEEFQSEWTAAAPEFTATPPDSSGGARVPIQELPSEDWGAQPSLRTALQAPLLRPLMGKNNH